MWGVQRQLPDSSPVHPQSCPGGAGLLLPWPAAIAQLATGSGIQHLLGLGVRCFESFCLGIIAKSKRHKSHVDAVIERLRIVIFQGELQGLGIKITGALGIDPAALEPPATSNRPASTPIASVVARFLSNRYMASA